LNLRSYRNEVWKIMHHDSDNPGTETAVLRSYLDESGGEDPNTPYSVLGGMLIEKPALDLFEDEWDKMLLGHGVVGGLHMKEFYRPHGRFAYISDHLRQELFSEACYLIHKYRAVTMASTLSNQEYRACIPESVRKSFSVYAMGFSLIVMMNHKLAEFNKHTDPIPKAHSFMLKRFQPVAFLHLGSLTFDDDKVWGVLQASDLIAWGTRRRVSGVSFEPGGFSPIGNFLTLDDSHHAEIPWKLDWLKEFGANLATMIAKGEGFDDPTDEEIGEPGIHPV
jgi:Protein of unknown function (DUF3800)